VSDMMNRLDEDDQTTQHRYALKRSPDLDTSNQRVVNAGWRKRTNQIELRGRDAKHQQKSMSDDN
jgi:hypothetical protein